MILSKYLKTLNEDYGFAPPTPVQRPQASRPTSVNRLQPKTPQQPKAPISPQEKNKQYDTKSYFNYIVWTSKILKQGEIFRKNCYKNNCEQYEAGGGERRVCKDRCDVETCKRIIQLLRASMSKCSNAKDPNLCNQRYQQLIPLYSKKLNQISRKFINVEKKQKNREIKVG